MEGYIEAETVSDNKKNAAGIRRRQKRGKYMEWTPYDTGPNFRCMQNKTCEQEKD